MNYKSPKEGSTVFCFQFHFAWSLGVSNWCLLTWGITSDGASCEGSGLLWNQAEFLQNMGRFNSHWFECRELLPIFCKEVEDAPKLDLYQNLRKKKTTVFSS